ncbi:glycoside hydrolase [Moorena producens PAL-8-15-08-1]|uniref:Glycoside hydrolase n=1 Tax=Moorena producens PAL-8-15-08-1 TaxID=1458985 RepID=A0A1D8TTW7_9CYAN|nr:glycosyltransferase family 4 protein [Moorena producens]AOX01005.1 glycoside hydrolase [Moorena producens PAL-8-15-08-1]
MQKLILTIFYQFNPWHSSIGGIQTVIRSFIKYAPSEFEVRLVGTGDLASASGVWQEGELAGRAIQFMPLFPLEDDNVRRLIPTTLKYTTALFGRSLASDFMHFHRIEPSLAALNWSGEKTLFVHNDIAKQMNPATANNGILWQRFSASYFALERLLVKQFSQIFSCNTESAKFYQQRYPAIANRVAYLKNTVDDEVFYALNPKEREQGRKALAQEHNLCEQTRFILFAGRLHPQKDPMLLIQAMAALYNPNVHLLIAGDGELRDELRAEICFLGLSKRVTMLGAVGQEKLADLYRVCSVFVLTSVYEGLPLTVLEALACGTPVVTTNCGETPKFLGADSGIVCKERTAVAIADSLGKVLHHPENYPASSCVRTAQPYSARTVVSSVYEQMLNRAHQRSL